MKNGVLDRYNSESRKSILWMAFCVFAILATVALFPSRSLAQLSDSNGNKTAEAVTSYPDVLLSVKSIDGIVSRPEYLGMSPAEWHKKVDTYNKFQKQLSTTTLSSDLFEMLVSFFSKGDPNLARQLRSSVVFKQAVAVLLDPSAKPDDVNVALGKLSEISGMNRRDMLAGLSNLNPGAGEKFATAKNTLAENLAAANIANAQAPMKNGLQMAGFDSPDVLAANEGNRIYAPSLAKAKTEDASEFANGGTPTAINDGSGFLNATSPTNLGSGEAGSLPVQVGAANRARSQSGSFGMPLGHGGMTADPTPAPKYIPISSGGTAPAAAKAAVIDTAASDPMMSLLGGDFANPMRYKGRKMQAGSGSRWGEGDPKDGPQITIVKGRSRIADDYINCRGKLNEKANTMTLGEICKSTAAPGCANTVECQCYKDFQKDLPEHGPETKTVAEKVKAFEAKKMGLCDFRKKVCAEDINVIENGKLAEILTDRMGTYERKTSGESGKTYQTKATALLGELNSWVDESTTTAANGQKYSPIDRLNFIMNILAGTNRGLCLLANGRDELPFGENREKKAPFQFYESETTKEEISKAGKYPKACARLDNTDLSGDWKSQSDRLQVMAFFHVLDQMREVGFTEKLTTQNAEQGLVESFEDRILDPHGITGARSQAIKASNALATALDPTCGHNGWFGVLESAEKTLRSAAFACGVIPEITKAYTTPENPNELLGISVCNGFNNKKNSSSQVSSGRSELVTGDDFDKSTNAAPTLRIIASTDYANDKKISSNFLRDYLKMDHLPPPESAACKEIKNKYLNINKLLTRIYQGNAKSGITVASFCQKYEKNRPNGH